jgi:hypothetical protein
VRAGVYVDIDVERLRASLAHGADSMEAAPVDSLRRLAILLEEVGEVAKEFNEAAIGRRPVDLVRLRRELIQTAAMAAAWAEAAGRVVAAEGAVVEPTEAQWAEAQLNAGTVVRPTPWVEFDGAVLEGRQP